MAAWLKLLLDLGPELVGLIERIIAAVEAAGPRGPKAKPKRRAKAKPKPKAKAKPEA